MDYQQQVATILSNSTKLFYATKESDRRNTGNVSPQKIRKLTSKTLNIFGNLLSTCR